MKFAEKAGEGYLVRKKERGSFQPEWPRSFMRFIVIEPLVMGGIEEEFAKDG